MNNTFQQISPEDVSARPAFLFALAVAVSLLPGLASSVLDAPAQTFVAVTENFVSETSVLVDAQINLYQAAGAITSMTANNMQAAVDSSVAANIALVQAPHVAMPPEPAAVAAASVIEPLYISDQLTPLLTERQQLPALPVFVPTPPAPPAPPELVAVYVPASSVADEASQTDFAYLQYFPDAMIDNTVALEAAVGAAFIGAAQQYVAAVGVLGESFDSVGQSARSAAAQLSVISNTVHDRLDAPALASQ